MSYDDDGDHQEQELPRMLTSEIEAPIASYEVFHKSPSVFTPMSATSTAPTEMLTQPFERLTGTSGRPDACVHRKWEELAETWKATVGLTGSAPLNSPARLSSNSQRENSPLLRLSALSKSPPLSPSSHSFHSPVLDGGYLLNSPSTSLDKPFRPYGFEYPSPVDGAERISNLTTYTSICVFDRLYGQAKVPHSPNRDASPTAKGKGKPKSKTTKEGSKNKKEKKAPLKKGEASPNATAHTPVTRQTNKKTKPAISQYKQPWKTSSRHQRDFGDPPPPIADRTRGNELKGAISVPSRLFQPTAAFQAKTGGATAKKYHSPVKQKPTKNVSPERRSEKKTVSHSKSPVRVHPEETRTSQGEPQQQESHPMGSPRPEILTPEIVRQLAQQNQMQLQEIEVLKRQLLEQVSPRNSVSAMKSPTSKNAEQMAAICTPSPKKRKPGPGKTPISQSSPSQQPPWRCASKSPRSFDTKPLSPERRPEIQVRMQRTKLLKDQEQGPSSSSAQKQQSSQVERSGSRTRPRKANVQSSEKQGSLDWSTTPLRPRVQHPLDSHQMIPANNFSLQIPTLLSPTTGPGASEESSEQPFLLRARVPATKKANAQQILWERRNAARLLQKWWRKGKSSGFHLPVAKRSAGQTKFKYFQEDLTIQQKHERQEGPVAKVGTSTADVVQAKDNENKQQSQERRNSATLLQNWWRARRQRSSLYSHVATAGASLDVQAKYKECHNSIQQKHQLMSAYRQARCKVGKQHPTTPQQMSAIKTPSLSGSSTPKSVSLREKWKASQPAHQRNQAAKQMQSQHTSAKLIQKWYRQIAHARTKRTQQEEAAVAIQVRWKYHYKVLKERLADQKAAEMLQLCWWRKLSPQETQRVEKDTTNHAYSHIPQQVQNFVREARQDRAAEAEMAKLLLRREEEERTLADDEEDGDDEYEEDMEFTFAEQVHTKQVEEDLQKLPVSSRHRSTRESLIIEPTMDLSTESLLTPSSPPMSPKPETSLPTVELYASLRHPTSTPTWQITCPLEESSRAQADELVSSNSKVHSPDQQRTPIKKVPSHEAKTPVRGSRSKPGMQSAERGAHVRKVFKMRQQAACVKLQGWSRMVSCQRAYELQKRLKAKKQHQNTSMLSAEDKVVSTSKTKETVKDGSAAEIRWEETISPLKSPRLTVEEHKWEESPTLNKMARTHLMIPKLQSGQVGLSAGEKNVLIGEQLLSMEKTKEANFPELEESRSDVRGKLVPDKQGKERKITASDVIAKVKHVNKNKMSNIESPAKVRTVDGTLQVRHIDLSVGAKKVVMEKQRWEEKISPRRKAGKPLQPPNADRQWQKGAIKPRVPADDAEVSPGTIDLEGLYRKAFALRQLELREMCLARIRAASLLQRWWTTSLLVRNHRNKSRRARTQIQAVYRGHLFGAPHQDYHGGPSVIQNAVTVPPIPQPTSPEPSPVMTQRQEPPTHQSAIIEEAASTSELSSEMEEVSYVDGAKKLAKSALIAVVFAWAVLSILVLVAMHHIDGVVGI